MPIGSFITLMFSVAFMLTLMRFSTAFYALVGAVLGYAVCVGSGYPDRPPLSGLFDHTTVIFVEPWIVVVLSASFAAWRGRQLVGRYAHLSTLRATASMGVVFVAVHVLLFVGVLLTQMRFAYPYIPWPNALPALVGTIPAGLRLMIFGLFLEDKGWTALLLCLACGPVVAWGLGSSARGSESQNTEGF